MASITTRHLDDGMQRRLCISAAEQSRRCDLVVRRRHRSRSTISGRHQNAREFEGCGIEVIDPWDDTNSNTNPY